MKNDLSISDASSTGMSNLSNIEEAVDVFRKVGNKNLILCERGVSSPHTHRETSRFILDIQAIPALQEITSLPVISDPSHASFWAPWVPSLTYASIAAGCDGLIIEIHKNPKKSAVDPLQPLNFNQFKKLIKESRRIAKALNRRI